MKMRALREGEGGLWPPTILKGGSLSFREGIYMWVLCRDARFSMVTKVRGRTHLP